MCHTVTDASSNGERYMSANGVLQKIGPSDPDEWRAIERAICRDYERSYPDDTFENLKARARFSKEDKGLLRDWMKIGAAKRTITPSRAEKAMSTGVLYAAVVTAKGGREGHVRSSDGVLDLELAMPAELGGPGGPKTNPEQLFAAGYAACFEGAVRLAAGDWGLSLGPGTQVTANVGIGPRTQGGFSISVELEVRIDGLEAEQKSEIVEVAHQKICPYSHATRGNVDVRIHII